MNKIIFSFLICFSLLGCAQKPICDDPEEATANQIAEERRVQEVLTETSPRNMNQQPKAVPEFRAKVPGWKVPTE